MGFTLVPPIIPVFLIHSGIVLRELVGDKIEKNALKNIIGGCDTIGGGVIITCDASPGQCWSCGYTDNDGTPCGCFTGRQGDYCSEPKCSSNVCGNI